MINAIIEEMEDIINLFYEINLTDDEAVIEDKLKAVYSILNNFILKTT